MKTIIKLIKGEIYFRVGFIVPDLTIPSIYTYVYEGYDDEHGHLFQDAETYVEKLQGKSAEGGHYLSSPEGAEPTMLDKKNLIEWLEKEHSPILIGKSYEYKVV